MSEAPELTTDAMQEAYEKLKSWGFAAGSYHCFCSECGKTHTADKRAWRCLECAEKRADLLPVVKPLEWVEHCDQTGGCHSVSAYNPNLWGYVIEASDPEGPFGLWSPDEGEVVDSPRLGLDYPTVAAAKAAAQADYETRIRACLDMIDPDALVAGAYEAAVQLVLRQVDGPMKMGLSQDIRDLTLANAQDALDAAIAKAVNAKLDVVAAKVAPMTIKIAGTPYQAGCGQIADAILTMKKPE